jgi:hypothetical protein
MQTLCGRPLTFGDVEQIKEINKQQKEMEPETKLEEAKKAGTLKKFLVTYSIYGEDDEIVEAIDCDHAEILWEKRNRHNENEIISIKEV